MVADLWLRPGHRLANLIKPRRTEFTTISVPLIIYTTLCHS